MPDKSLFTTMSGQGISFMASTDEQEREFTDMANLLFHSKGVSLWKVSRTVKPKTALKEFHTFKEKWEKKDHERKQVKKLYDWYMKMKNKANLHSITVQCKKVVCKQWYTVTVTANFV